MTHIILGSYKCDLCRSTLMLQVRYYYRHIANKKIIEKCRYDCCSTNSTSKIIVERTYNLAKRINDMETIYDVKLDKNKNYIMCDECVGKCFPTVGGAIELEIKELGKYAVLYTHTKTDNKYYNCRQCDKSTNKIIKHTPAFKKFNEYICRDCYNLYYCCGHLCREPGVHLATCCGNNYCDKHIDQHEASKVHSGGICTHCNDYYRSSKGFSFDQ